MGGSRDVVDGAHAGDVGDLVDVPAVVSMSAMCGGHGQGEPGEAGK